MNTTLQQILTGHLPRCETENANFHTYGSLNQNTVSQAEGRNKAMDNNSMDVVSKVITKLATLDDLFSFYWIACDKANFQKKSLTGLSFIIADCIDELEGILR